MIKIFIAVPLIILSCSGQMEKSQVIHKKEQDDLVLKEDTFIETNTQDMILYDDLLKLSKKEALNKYGQPASQEEFILDDLQGEFRIELNNFYNKEVRLSESVKLDEVTWEKDKDTWITVWYEVDKNETLPVHSLTWKKGSEF